MSCSNWSTFFNFFEDIFFSMCLVPLDGLTGVDLFTQFMMWFLSGLTMSGMLVLEGVMVVVVVVVWMEDEDTR